MTKNNAFKKTIRAYMETHNLSYTAARKILDEEAYLKGTGAITLIVGATGTGKTITLREMLKTQTLPTAVLVVHEQEIDYVGPTHHFLDVLEGKSQLQNLVEEKKYSQFAIDSISGADIWHPEGENYLLDDLPRKADLILTIQCGPDMANDIEKILGYLDSMKLSREKLSKRVKLVRQAYRIDYRPFGLPNNRFHVADYHL
jgi:ABC-type cobalamin/Fe3+-siderophores transport system ATPase subunit